MQLVQKTLLAFALGFVLTGCAIAGAESDLESKVEAGVRSLLRAIQAHDVPTILSFVGPSGVEEDNRVVSKNEIAAQLRDESSYLSQSLFGEPTAEEVANCVEKLNGKLYVSPAAFMSAYGDNYSIRVGRIDEFKGLHYGVKIESEGDAKPGCQFELFWLRMKVIDDKVLLASSFFQ